MNELIFLAGVAVGIGIGVSALARLWRVDLRDPLKRV
jgi:hypothetical protein